ncbi:hypothetical protein BDB01DRAFT_854046 [Pilobolus umbonatus]|nr:hypothetical protein BDB01DRAFT_854046 [Pilobolus umbonatus]
MASHVFQKIVNVLVYLFFLSATVYSVVGPSPSEGQEQEGSTFITPSYWIESVWSLVHVLLGGFVIYQWFDAAHEAAIHGVGWHFAISVLLNAAWLALIRTGHYIIGFFFVLLTAASVSFVFYRLAKEFPSNNIWDKIFVHAPFSLWHGWIVYSSVINFFQMFSTFRDSATPNVWHIIAVIIGLLFLTSTAIAYVEVEKQRGDVTGALVIGLGLIAIFTNQHDAWIKYTALATGILSLLYPLRLVVIRMTGRNSNENAPLLG